MITHLNLSLMVKLKFPFHSYDHSLWVGFQLLMLEPKAWEPSQPNGLPIIIIFNSTQKLVFIKCLKHHLAHKCLINVSHCESRCLHCFVKAFILKLLNIKGNTYWNLFFTYKCVILTKCKSLQLSCRFFKGNISAKCYMLLRVAAELENGFPQ